MLKGCLRRKGGEKMEFQEHKIFIPSWRKPQERED